MLSILNPLSFQLFFTLLLLNLLFILNVNIIECISITKLNSINCPASDYSPLEVISHATPKGIGNVGQFTKRPDDKSLYSCTVSCCRTSTCNVVFFHNNSCFHITCHSMQLCEPIKRSGTKFSKTSMVFVRNIPDITDSAIFSTDYSENDDEYQDSKQRRENRFNSITNDYNSGTDIERPESDIICNIGMKECPENEICKKSSNRRRQGICECVKGWTRDEQRLCQPINESIRKKFDNILTEEDHQNIDSSMISNSTDVGGGSGGGNVLSSPSASTHLVVSAGANQVIQLPQDETTISAFVMPSSKSYKYEWKLISKPSTTDEIGNMEGSNTDHIKLSHLKAGNYTFIVTVTDKDLKGVSTVNVTVLPPTRVNTPPVAVIQPANSTVQLPNKDTVLDGSFSTDDNNNKIVKYEWQAVTVPIGFTNIQLPSSPTLQLKDLLPGLYQIKLTVTDSDGAINSTIANITVLKEIDYPPTANAGQDQIIFLPMNEITLMGNQSTDDKGIVTWQWRRPSDENNVKLTADMDGTSTPFLHLSKLEVGVYKFVLKVTDTSNQSSTAEVHVFVKPENNQPPVAITNKDIKVVLPVDKPIILDGSQSHDDSGVTKWLWEQISGPKQLQIINANESKANLSSKLIPGDYEFRLSVWDSKEANSSSTVKVSVIQAKNSPPIANAGGDKTVTLPVSEVILNGNQSSDDVEIVSYVWERTSESLAFGDVIDNSSYTPVLRLTNLIIGRYLFRLTVTDSQGSQSSDVASLIVKASADISDQIELILNSDIKAFTSEQQLTVLKRLELLINDGQPIKVLLNKLDATTHTRRVILIFTVLNANTNKRISGPKVVKQLKQKLKTDSSLITPEVISIETLVCQNECSNHGSCDQYTKRCLCEAFWMEDLIRFHLGDSESNCDWSILYVIVISFTIVITVMALFWTCVCCISHIKTKRPVLKTRKYRKSNRNRYTLLEDDYDITGADRMELLANNVKQLNSKTLMTDSSDSQSDTLFDMNATNNILNNKLNSNSNQHQKRHQKSLNGLIGGKDNRKVRA